MGQHGGGRATGRTWRWWSLSTFCRCPSAATATLLTSRPPPLTCGRCAGRPAAMVFVACCSSCTCTAGRRCRRAAGRAPSCPLTSSSAMSKPPAIPRCRRLDAIKALFDGLLKAIEVSVARLAPHTGRRRILTVRQKGAVGGWRAGTQTDTGDDKELLVTVAGALTQAARMCILFCVFTSRTFLECPRPVDSRARPRTAWGFDAHTQAACRIPCARSTGSSSWRCLATACCTASSPTPHLRRSPGRRSASRRYAWAPRQSQPTPAGTSPK